MNASSIVCDPVPVALRDVKVGDKNLHINCIVLENENTVTTKDGNTIKAFRVADRSGSMTLTLWDDQGCNISGGDIVFLQKAQAIVFRSSLQLNLMKGGGIFKRGDFCMVFVEAPFISAPNPELDNIGSQPPDINGQNSTSNTLPADTYHQNNGAIKPAHHNFSRANHSVFELQANRMGSDSDQSSNPAPKLLQQQPVMPGGSGSDHFQPPSAKGLMPYPNGVRHHSNGGVNFNNNNLYYGAMEQKHRPNNPNLVNRFQTGNQGAKWQNNGNPGRGAFNGPRHANSFRQKNFNGHAPIRQRHHAKHSSQKPY